MSISSRITQMEQHIGNAYDKIEDLGIDLTDVDKNIDNISSMLENVWDEYPKVTATDVEEASLNGTKKGRMEIDLKGNTEQDTLTGKNKLQITATIETKNGLTLTVYNDKTFKVTGTINTDTAFNFVLVNMQNFEPFLDKQMCLSCGYSITNNMGAIVSNFYDNNIRVLASNAFNITSSNSYTTKTVSSSTYDISNGINIRVTLFIPEGNNGKAINISGYIQLEEGSTVTSYEPYCGGIPSPNPDYPQAIKNVTGNANVKIQNKNLLNIERELGEPTSTDFANTTKRFFNYNTYVKGITGANNYSSSAVKDVVIEDNNVSFTTVNGYYGLGFPIKVKPNTNYYFSVTELSANSLVRIMFYDKDGTYLSNVNKGSFTTPSNCDCILVFLTGSQANTTYNFTNLQIEQGTTATDFVPHQEQNYPFSLKSKNLVNIPDKTLNSSGYIYNGTIDLKAGKYTLSIGESSQDSFSIAIIGESGTLVSGSITLPYTFTINEKATSMRLYSPGAGTFKNIMIEQGSTATDYEPYYDIKAMQGTTLEDDGIHNKRSRYAVTGAGWYYYGIESSFNPSDLIFPMTYYGSGVSKSKRNGALFCTGLKVSNGIVYAKSGEAIGNLVDNAIYITLYKSTFGATTQNTYQECLALARDFLNNCNWVVEFERTEPEIISYNSTQQAQYNAIKQAKSYDDQTNISSTSDELGFIMDVESLRKIDN